MKRIFRFLSSELGRITLGGAIFLSAHMTELFGGKYFALALYITALAVSGFTVFRDAVLGIIRRDFLDEKFLMSIASVGAIMLGEWLEGVAVMLFFLVGEFFEHKAVARSRKSIRELMDICPDTANVLIDGEEVETDAEDVEEGSLIVVRSGERVPLDSVVIEGSSDVDTSALTGEAIPRAVKAGDEVKSGSVLVNGVLTAKTLRVADESAAARILSLVENANEAKSKEENFITKFSRIYTPTVVILAILLAVVPPIFGWRELGDSVYRALTFLVVSCPCALVISVPMSFFGGIGCAASRGILFKGGNIFSPLAKAKTFAFDKTGTLTTGDFTVNSVEEIKKPREDILRLASLAEYASRHPISEAIKREYPTNEKPASSCEIAGQGVRAVIDGKDIFVGNRTLMTENGVDISAAERDGVYVAEGKELLGVINIGDKLKDEAEVALKSLRTLGADKLVMLSGDKRENAERIGESVGLDEVHAELLPEEKYAKLEELLKSDRSKLVYVGDGINDAPSLARADVGVAMGAIGSDSAISSSDLVIMSDKLDKLPTAVKIARRTLFIAKENIIFALAVKFSVLALSAFWEPNMILAVFADVGVAVIAILNAMRTLLMKRK